MYIGVCHMYWSAECNLWGVELNLLEFEMQETSASNTKWYFVADKTLGLLLIFMIIGMQYSDMVLLRRDVV